MFNCFLGYPLHSKLQPLVLFQPPFPIRILNPRTEKSVPTPTSALAPSFHIVVKWPNFWALSLIGVLKGCLFGYSDSTNRRIAPTGWGRWKSSHDLTTRRTPLLHLFRSELLIWDFLFHLRVSHPTQPRFCEQRLKMEDSRMLDKCPNIFGRSYYTTIGCLKYPQRAFDWKTAMAAMNYPQIGW